MSRGVLRCCETPSPVTQIRSTTATKPLLPFGNISGCEMQHFWSAWLMRRSSLCCTNISSNVRVSDNMYSYSHLDRICDPNNDMTSDRLQTVDFSFIVELLDRLGLCRCPPTSSTLSYKSKESRSEQLYKTKNKVYVQRYID